MLGFLIFYIIFSGFVTISFYFKDDVIWFWAIILGAISGSILFPIILGCALYKIINNNSK